MAETIRLRIPAAVAPYLAEGAAADRLKAVSGSDRLTPADQVVLLFCLTRDADSDVRTSALSRLSRLASATLVEFIASDSPHPAVLDLLARLCYQRADISASLIGCSGLSERARDFLLGHAERLQSQAVPVSGTVPADSADPEELQDAEGESEESREYLSKYMQSQQMDVAEKIRMALTGDKEWRSILVRDANKLIAGSVVKNPRITEAEVLTLVKTGVQHDELIRLICANKEWVKNYQIRKALVENPRTPPQVSLRLLHSLSEKDISSYAKSRNVPSVISTQARRIMTNKK